MPSTPSQRIVTLTTDFGLGDEYVGVMKGAILCVNPTACIIDITHGVEPQNIMEAAYVIEAAFRYFSTGTIHVIVVDPGVGTHRAILGVESNGHVFLAPDNGVLTLLLERGVDRLVRADNPVYHADVVSPTFHGRDIFAPLAGHLSRGTPFETIGGPVVPEQAVRLADIHPLVKDGPVIQGRIVRIDRFGNLITNISSGLLQSLEIQPDAVRMSVGVHQVRGLSTTYADAPPHGPLALIGSRGFLEIAVNRGSASSAFDAQTGQEVRISP